MKAAVDAVLNGNVIEKNIEGNINGNDVGAGFDEGWVSMLEFNDIVVADGTKEAVESVIEQLNKGKLTVFKGDYIGVKQDNPQDTIDLRDGYIENKDSSAPTFDYILKDIITIE
jgi:basic membrane protein A